MISGLGVKLMRRRDFITLLGGGVVAWPLAARGQQGERLRLVGVLEGISAGTSNANARTTAFVERLQQSGWTPGRNVRLEVRWGGGDQAAIRKHAAELVALAPDVIVAGGGAAAEVMLKGTPDLPVEAPIRYELAINLKTAKALGIRSRQAARS